MFSAELDEYYFSLNSIKLNRGFLLVPCASVSEVCLLCLLNERPPLPLTSAKTLALRSLTDWIVTNPPTLERNKSVSFSMI